MLKSKTKTGTRIWDYDSSKLTGVCWVFLTFQLSYKQNFINEIVGTEEITML